MGLTWKDGTATLMVAGAGALFWAYHTDQGWPGVSGPRVVTVAVFLLGVAICVSTTRNLAAKESELGLFSRIMRLHGLAAFGLTIWGAITGSELALAILVGLIGVMWLGSTIYHAVSPLPKGDVPPPR